jgi:hypothetical protein
MSNYKTRPSNSTLIIDSTAIQQGSLDRAQGRQTCPDMDLKSPPAPLFQRGEIPPYRRTPLIHFWRDQTGNEIVLLIEEENTPYPVEIKSGSTVAPDMLSGLQRWMDLAGPAAKSPTLVYGGAEAYTRQGISVRPRFAA